MKSVTMVLCLMLLAAGALWAVPVTVDFVDGTVQVQSGSTWKTLDFGDIFDSAQIVRIGQRALAELSVQGGTKLVLSAAGNYVVDNMLGPRQESTVIGNIATKIERLANQRTNLNESVVAGVRGSAAVDPTALMWAGVGPDAEAAFEDGSKSFAAADFASAWDYFVEARELYTEAGDIEGVARSAWHAAQSGLALGSGGRALAALRSADPANAAELRAAYALALATLSARYGAATEAKALLVKALAEKWFDTAETEADARLLLSAL